MTRNGIRFGGGCLGAVLVGRVLGLPELVGCAIAGLLLCGVAWLLVLARRPRLDVVRSAHPAQSTVGDWVTVQLTITNLGRWRSPTALLRDPVMRRGQVVGAPEVRVSVGPLAPGKTIEATYRIDTPRRGLVVLGPMTVSREDPFGLAQSRQDGPGPSSILVLPRIEEVLVPTSGRTDDPTGVSVRPHGALDRGDEFAALRVYVPGDDLRRVHWSTSARRGTLMVRQNERPRQPRCTVLLDVRSASYESDEFERAVELAAGYVSAAITQGDETRLVSTAGLDSHPGIGAGHLDLLLQELALVELEPGRSFTIGAASLDAGDDSLVIVTTERADPTAFTTRRRQQRSKHVVTV